ncbi:MAG: ABC transporter ATP-binding protein [Trueperaceae bacterium]|nr:MAG: ABC transporter ATP-binding protein [Trueperaceae bacterium]
MSDSVPGTTPLITIRGLQTHFFTQRGVAKVLDGLNFEIASGRVTGLVGESGSGKSVTAFSIMRLMRAPGRIVAGKIEFQGVNLLQLTEREMAKVRGEKISMIFQQPRASLNPVFTVKDTLLRVLRIHKGLSARKAQRAALEVLARVGLPDPAVVLNRYPHQLSGGMCQRVMIALAISCGSKLLLADEPTTALDVTVQFQIIELLKELEDETGLTQLLITHDLGLVAELCSEVAVMYAGEIVEQAGVHALFDQPSHPYTRGLLQSRPKPGARGELQSIPGRVPDLLAPPSGCRFHPRCPLAQSRCAEESPVPEIVGEGHWVRCHFWRDLV